MVVTWNLGFGWISGRALPALLPPHDESQCTANCPSERDSRLLFSFILLHAGHVRHRVLIDHRVGLLNLVVVGQGDKRKVWPVPAICHSFDCHVLVGDRAEPDKQRSSSVVTAHPWM